MAKKKEQKPFVPRDAAQIFADEMGEVLKQMRVIVKQARANLEKQEDYLWFQRMNLVGIEKEIEAMDNERIRSLDVLGGVNVDMHESASCMHSRCASAMHCCCGCRRSR